MPKTESEALKQLLKKKGIGPSMSEGLSPEDVQNLDLLIRNESLNLTTKITLLTAILTLKKNPDEAQWISHFRENLPANIHPDIRAFLAPAPTNTFLATIQRVIAGNDLNATEMTKAFTEVLSQTTPEHLKAAFLEAQRLKRETLTENIAVYETLWAATQHIPCKVPILIDFANAYDGLNRHPLLVIFTAVLLGSIGVPSLIHGVDEVAPKKGLTFYHLLLKAKKDPLKILERVCADIESKDIAWGYADQRHFTPALFDLKDMRTHMVKRPLLATVEKLMQPIRTQTGNFLVTGYTHPAYRDMMVNLLEETKKTPKAFVFRGVEGSAWLPSDRKAPFVYNDGKNKKEGAIRPAQFGLEESPKIAPNYEITVEDSLKLGEAALKGHKGPIRDSLVYNATAILATLDIFEAKIAVQRLEESLDSGLAWQHWKRGMQ